MWRTLALFRDHLEYETPGLLGLGAKQLAMPVEDIGGAAFPAPTKLVLATAEGEISVSFERPAEGELAREALRRMGVPCDDD